MRRFLAYALLFLAFAATPRRARAAPPEGASAADPPVGIALAAGAATALIPLALGASFAAGTKDYGQRNVGYAVAGAGLAISPIMAHVIVGEYARGAAFGAVPVACEIGIVSLVSVMPNAVFSGSTGSRTTFAILFSLDAFGATLGLVDIALAATRARERLPKPLRGLTVLPVMGRDRAGIAVGGVL